MDSLKAQIDSQRAVQCKVRQPVLRFVPDSFETRFSLLLTRCPVCKVRITSPFSCPSTLLVGLHSREELESMRHEYVKLHVQAQ